MIINRWRLQDCIKLCWFVTAGLSPVAYLPSARLSACWGGSSKSAAVCNFSAKKSICRKVAPDFSLMSLTRLKSDSCHLGIAKGSNHLAVFVTVLYNLICPLLMPHSLTHILNILRFHATWKRQDVLHICWLLHESGQSVSQWIRINFCKDQINQCTLHHYCPSFKCGLLWIV